ncbi:MAG: acyloxyacyl hydrolase, partial [Acidobacteriaceae bacterium]
MMSVRFAPVRHFAVSLLVAALWIAAPALACAQTAPSDIASDTPAKSALAQRSWEYGPFFQYMNGAGARSDFHFTAAGFRLGKVITPPLLHGFFRGQFEYAGEIMPYWQAFTPAPHTQPQTYYDPATGLDYQGTIGVGGGTYTGVSLTPIILRWDFTPRRRFAPWFQAAGGLIYTTHKFPPDTLVPHGQPGGTSVWNFSPQGGGGIQYFLKPGQSLMFAISGVDI